MKVTGTLCAACLAQETTAQAAKDHPGDFPIFAYVFVMGMAEVIAHSNRRQLPPLCPEHTHDLGVISQQLAARDAAAAAASGKPS